MMWNKFGRGLNFADEKHKEHKLTKWVRDPGLKAMRSETFAPPHPPPPILTGLPPARGVANNMKMVSRFRLNKVRHVLTTSVS